MPRGLPTLLFILLIAVGTGAITWYVAHTGAQSDAAPTTMVGRPVPAVGWGSFKTMTANMRLDEPSDGDNGWVHRRELVVRTLLKYEPDIIGCQELLPSQQAYLNKELMQWYGYYPREGVGTSSAPASRGMAAEVVGAINDAFASLNTLYYRTDRFDLLDGEAGLVVPEEPQASVKENAFYTLAVLRQKAAPAEKGPTLIVIDVHLRHGDEFAARCATRLRGKIAKWLEKYPGSGEILLGDMNHGRDSQSYAAIVAPVSASTPTSMPAVRLVDTFDYSQKPAPSETIGTFHNFTGRSDRPLPTDLIFVGGDLVSVAPAEILHDHGGMGNRAGEWPSDHFFVMADVAFAHEKRAP